MLLTSSCVVAELGQVEIDDSGLRSKFEETRHTVAARPASLAICAWVSHIRFMLYW